VAENIPRFAKTLAEVVREGRSVREYSGVKDGAGWTLGFQKTRRSLRIEER
jgi:hypothetical protein